jgi:hypothetical protein
MLIRFFAVVLLAASSGCVVRPVAPPVVAVRGCVWIPGHYGPRGAYIPGHCR